MGRDSPERRTPWDLQEAETVECPKCSDVFLHKGSLERHLRVEHGPQVFYWCGRCEHKNNRRDSLRAHCRDCHSSQLEEVSEISVETYESRWRDKHTGSEGKSTPTAKKEEKLRHTEGKSGGKRGEKIRSAGRSDVKSAEGATKCSREKGDLNK